MTLLGFRAEQISGGNWSVFYRGRLVSTAATKRRALELAIAHVGARS